MKASAGVEAAAGGGRQLTRPTAMATVIGATSIAPSSTWLGEIETTVTP
jgi:hypothetical protein